MSMLSKQCKELRTEAERIGYWNPTASRLMLDAADILWSLRNKNVALLGENDKLRELVRAAWRCIHTGASCYDCRLIAGGCTLQSAMRELGVEVES